MKTKTLFLLISLLATPGCYAQTAIKFQAGFGYLEHFSIGTALEWNAKNRISLHYGSDFFYRPQNFSTFFLKYNRSISSLTYRRITPGIGAKIGYTIFTDTYYRWKTVTAVPYISCNYKIDDRLDLGAEGGVAISRIESVTRVSYGEIGKYKQYLPELNISLYYTILNRNRD